MTEEQQYGSPEMVSRSRPKSLIGNAGWNLLSWGWLTAVTFLLTPFLIARLGTDYYGLYILVMAVSGLMGLADLGLADATLRYVAHYSSRQDMTGVNRTVGATLSVYLATGSLVGAGFYLAAPWIAGLLALPVGDLALATNLLRITAVSFGLMIVTGAYGTIPRALLRYDIESKVTIGQNLVQVVGTVALLLAGQGVRELVLWGMVSTIARQATNIAVARRLIPSLRLLPSPSRAGLREVFGYGVFASLTQIADTISFQADRLLLGSLVSASAVAYLNVPKSLVQRAHKVPWVAGDVLFPRFSATQDLAEQRRLFLDATWSMLCLTAIVFVPVVVLLPDFLRLWVGPEFARESSRIGQLLALGALPRGAFVASQKLFQGMGKPQYVTVWILVSGVLLTALNILLIGRFGLQGAGYAGLIELAVPFTALLLAWRRVLRSDAWHPFVRAVCQPLVLSLGCLGLAWWVRSALPGPGWVGLIGLASALLLGTAAVLLAADRIGSAQGSRASAIWGSLQRQLEGSSWKRWLAEVRRPR